MRNFNFQECHEEKIHIPGHIQSFGYLIVLHYDTWNVKYVSENIAEVFGVKPYELMGRRLREFPIIADTIVQTETSQSFRNSEPRNKVFQPEMINVLGIKYYYQLFTSENLIYLEFEKVYDNSTNRNILLNLGNDVLRVESEEELWQSLVNEISTVIGYDRVMIYRFLPDGSGKVIAENKNDNLESLLNVHFPESDIPRQARELYLKKRKRIVSNVNSKVVQIISDESEPLNMEFVSARAVSPIHLEYLRNSGVEASFSTSIVVNDALWGIVACQNLTPKHIDLYDRQISEVLTRITANTFMALQSKKQLRYSHSFYQKTLDLKEEMLLEEDLDDIENLADYLNNFVLSDGTAVFMPNKLIVKGITPDKARIEQIVNWAVLNLEEDIFYTDNLYDTETVDFEKDEKSPGIMVLILDRAKRKVAIWFKSESVRQIRWAGLQDKNFEERNLYGEEVMVKTPRKSFEIVKETLKGRSEQWTDSDIVGITILQNLILKTTQEKNARITELNQTLKEKNEELDAFSYTVSHDLRSPLTVMGLNAQQLLNKTQDESQKSKVQQILDQVNDLTEMMNDILNLSRANHSEIELNSLNPQTIIDRVIQEAGTNFGTENTEIITGDFLHISADRTMAYQVFSNVIGNAVKYSSRKDFPKVEITSREYDDKIVYYISDNGIGISDESKHKMFQLYSRQPNAMEFKGSGVGLSIVKRLMNRMGGDIDFESEKDVGTVFHLIFDKPV